MKIRLLPLILALLLWTGAVPAAAETYESPKDICSPWAEFYASHARSVNLTPWEAEAQDLTRNATPAQFTEYINSLCKRIWEQSNDSFPAMAGDTVTREDAAVCFANMAEHYGMQTDFPLLISFTDAEDISPDCRAAVDTVCRMGLFVGDENGDFDPHRPITREETIAVCIRFANSIPYLMNKEELPNGTFQRYNFLWIWVEDADGKLLYALPRKWLTYDYRNWGVENMIHITLNGQFVFLCSGSRTPEEEKAHYIMDPKTMDTLYTISLERGSFYGVSADGAHLIFSQLRSSGETWDFGYFVYGVYDLAGNETVPMGASEEDLKAAGYLAP